MENRPVSPLTEQFSNLKDPRIDRTKRHKLIDIVTIAICAVVCGADTCVDVELFGKSKKEWLSGILDLPNGIPSHDTFGRVFAMLDAKQFEAGFIEWVRRVSNVTQGQIVAIDGKTVRRSHDKRIGKGAIHMVSAWASAHRMILGQTKVDAKSNEITAIPELLRVLEVPGCIVTIDAMGCQKEIAQTITGQGADYVLALKENQPQLYQDVKDTFNLARQAEFSSIPHDFHETLEKSHGRIETGRCWTISDPDLISYLDDRRQWKKLNSIAMVESRREVDGKVSVESRFYISSLPGDSGVMLNAVRGHWGIENSVHWVLDIAFREDESRVRKGDAAENLSVLRRMTLNMLKHETTSKGGIAAKRKRAGWDTEYLLKVLAQSDAIALGPKPTERLDHLVGPASACMPFMPPCEPRRK